MSRREWVASLIRLGKGFINFFANRGGDWKILRLGDWEIGRLGDFKILRLGRLSCLLIPNS